MFVRSSWVRVVLGLVAMKAEAESEMEEEEEENGE